MRYRPKPTITQFEREVRESHVRMRRTQTNSLQMSLDEPSSPRQSAAKSVAEEGLSVHAAGWPPKGPCVQGPGGPESGEQLGTDAYFENRQHTHYAVNRSESAEKTGSIQSRLGQAFGNSHERWNRPLRSSSDTSAKKDSHFLAPLPQYSVQLVDFLRPVYSFGILGGISLPVDRLILIMWSTYERGRGPHRAGEVERPWTNFTRPAIGAMIFDRSSGTNAQSPD